MTVGFKSPSKTSFMIKHFEDKGLKVELKQEPVKLVSDCAQLKSSEKKEFSMLQLNLFKKAMVNDIIAHFRSLNKAAHKLGLHYCTLYNMCQPPQPKSHKHTQQKKQNENVL